MMSIGGYFELEIREGKHFHQGAIKLSTARQCFESVSYTHLRAHET